MKEASLKSYSGFHNTSATRVFSGDAASFILIILARNQEKEMIQEAFYAVFMGFYP